MSPFVIKTQARLTACTEGLKSNLQGGALQTHLLLQECNTPPVHIISSWEGFKPGPRTLQPRPPGLWQKQQVALADCDSWGLATRKKRTLSHFNCCTLYYSPIQEILLGFIVGLLGKETLPFFKKKIKYLRRILSTCLNYLDTFLSLFFRQN